MQLTILWHCGTDEYVLIFETFKKNLDEFLHPKFTILKIFEHFPNKNGDFFRLKIAKSHSNFQK